MRGWAGPKGDPLEPPGCREAPNARSSRRCCVGVAQQGRDRRLRDRAGHVPHLMSLVIVMLTACSVQPQAGSALTGTAVVPTEPTVATILQTPIAGETSLPGTQVPPLVPASPPETYQPNSGDYGMTVDKVFLDSVSVENSLGVPSGVLAILKGSLPTPCHELRVIVVPSNQPDLTVLKAYSLFKPGQVCIQTVQPFEVAIPLTRSGGPGEHRLIVNDREYLSFTWPS